MRIILFCPEWEVLYEKCVKIFEKLRTYYSNVFLINNLSVNDIRLVEVYECIVKLPQIVVTDDSKIIGRLSRDSISELDVDDIVRLILDSVSLSGD